MLLQELHLRVNLMKYFSDSTSMLLLDVYWGFRFLVWKGLKPSFGKIMSVSVCGGC
ncbi:hypothetical protein HanPI659440_Chr16g0658891 [Helianthus annuus]|nr:hypothetical protein HanPI659440_Chr16g0658891 [Helianthus annuus]